MYQNNLKGELLCQVHLQNRFLDYSIALFKLLKFGFSSSETKSTNSFQTVILFNFCISFGDNEKSKIFKSSLKCSSDEALVVKVAFLCKIQRRPTCAADLLWAFATAWTVGSPRTAPPLKGEYACTITPRDISSLTEVSDPDPITEYWS